MATGVDGRPTAPERGVGGRAAQWTRARERWARGPNRVIVTVNPRLTKIRLSAG